MDEKNQYMNNTPGDTGAVQADRSQSQGGIVLAVIGSLIAIAGSFMPIFSISILGVKKSVTGMQGDFLIFSCIGIAIILLALLRATKGENKKIAAVIGGGAAVIEAAVHYAYINQRAATAFSLGSRTIDISGLINMEIGFYLMIIGGILLFAAGGFLPSKKK